MADVAFRTKPCFECGQASTLSLDEDKLARWQAGEHVQNVWPEMSPDQRELIMTGTHPACWDAMFPPEEDEPEEPEEDELRLTRRQAAIVGLYTGVTAGPFEDIHELAQALAGRPIWTHEFAGEALVAELKEKVKPLFGEICAVKED